MIEPTIRSRPVYGTLRPAAAPAHLLVADADGGAALLDLVAAAPPAFAAAAGICYVPGASDHTAALASLGAARFHTSPTVHALLPRLAREFERMRMGTQVYLAGSEPLIGLATRAAMAAGIDHAALQCEHRGTLARRVQCVHCKGVTEDVTTQPAPCAHCGLMLLVRDHYSRRVAAFQGVNIDAEEPGTAPSPEPVFT